jgi:hypothetical protein
MDFASNKNKEILWNTLIEVGAFNNIKEDKKSNIKHSFDKIHKSLIVSKDNVPLIDLNKQFTLTMVNYLNTLKETSPIKEIYTSSQKPILNYQHTFDKKQPQKVSFKDDALDEPIKNIDDLMLKMQKERNLELPSKQDIKKAEQWLGNNKQSTHSIKPENPTITASSSIISNPTMDIETNQFLTKLKKQPTIEERLLAIEKDISLIKKKLSI